MPRPLNVHLLPELVPAEELTGGTAVVIDVLRASTTIAAALHAGASGVFPCLHVADARELAARFTAQDALLGGERDCVRIEGFDLGNSPREYDEATVGGKIVVFTTTNGTKALLRCHQATQIFVASFVNVSATAEAIAAGQSNPIHLLCAGTNDHVSREDVLFAGCVAEMLQRNAPDVAWQRNDSAELALAAWRQCDAANLAAELRVSRGGGNLARHDLEADIAVAAERDTLPVVAQFQLSAGVIRRM